MSALVDRSQAARRRALPTLLLAVFFVYFVLPLFWLVVSSTKSNDDLFSTFGLWFSTFHLSANLHDTFTYDDGIFLTWFGNSAFYAITSAVGTALVSTLAGYGFAKYRFRGRELLFAIVLGSIMIPQTALVIPIYLMSTKIGIIDTPLAVILPSLVSPFAVFLMRIYAEQAVPDELSFVATWNNYFLPLVVLSNQKLFPLTVGLAQWNGLATAGGGSQVLYSVVITGALVAIIPVAIAFLLLQRYWQGGLTVGGVK